MSFIDLLVRVVIYTVVMFLIMVVYTGQQHGEPRPILHDSLRKTGKFVGYTAILVVVMQACFWLFID